MALPRAHQFRGSIAKKTMHCSSPLPILFFSWSEKTAKFENPNESKQIQICLENFWSHYGQLPSLEIIISISFNYIPLPINAHFCLVPIYLSLTCKLFFRLKLHAFLVLCLSSLFCSSISWLLNKIFVSFYLLDYLRQWMIIYIFLLFN